MGTRRHSCLRLQWLPPPLVPWLPWANNNHHRKEFVVIFLAFPSRGTTTPSVHTSFNILCANYLRQGSESTIIRSEVCWGGLFTPKYSSPLIGSPPLLTTTSIPDPFILTVTPTSSLNPYYNSYITYTNAQTLQ